MSLEWITPKTNWAKTDIFAYTDYNRIRNNLLYLNDLLNERYPETAQPLDLGNALAFNSDYYPSQFNAFEDALESFTRVGLDANIGTKKIYKGNVPFIDFNELNRIEGCCLRWYNLDPVISHVTISPSDFYINIGDNQQLGLVVEPSSATYTVTWSSSNPTIATVSNSGLVTGVGSGNFTISATIKQRGQQDIVVTANGSVIVLATEIRLTPSDMNLTYCESARYEVVVIPSDATHKDDYELVADDPSVVNVFKLNKTIRALASGKTRVVASVDNVSSSINVTSMINKYCNLDGAVVFNDKIHALGGLNPAGDGNDYWHHAEWDEDTCEWVDLPSKPYRSSEARVVVYNNEIHLMGGTYGSQKYDYHRIWNGTLWRASTPLPFANRSFALVVYNNEIHMLGGYYGTTKHYKWNGSAWSQVSTLPLSFVSSKGMGAVVYNNEIHLIGGYQTNIGHYKWNGSTWQQASSLPMIASGIASVVYNNKIHIFGGYDLNDISKAYRHYEWNGNTWTRKADTKCQTRYGIVVVYNNKMFAFDGGNGISVNSFEDSNQTNMFIIDE